MRENTCLHSCKPTKDAKEKVEKEYNFIELFDHFHNECIDKETFCPNCYDEMESIEAIHDHLLEECPKVVITCDMCDKEMQRAFFKTH